MDIVLVNGTSAPRSRSSEGVTVLDCGCAHTATHWLQMCRPHYAEDSAIHEAALVIHAGRGAAPLYHRASDAREAAEVDPLLE